MINITSDIFKLLGNYILYTVAILLVISLLISFSKCIRKILIKYVSRKLKIFAKFKKKEENSISYLLEELSKKHYKLRHTIKYVNELSNKDSEDVLDGLKNKELVELFSIKASIEEYFNSSKDFDDDFLKYIGFIIVYIAGIISSAFSGIYSGIIANLFSEATLKTKGGNSPSNFETELAKNINKASEIITFDKILTPIIFSVLIIFSLIILLRILNYFSKKIDNNTIVLLDVVNYAIEVKKKELEKSKEMEKSKEKDKKNKELTEGGKARKEMKEIIKKLGATPLSAKKTIKLIEEGLDNITYEAIQEAVLNCHLSQLYNIKSNVKNAINAGKYSDSTEIQMVVTLTAVLIALKSNLIVLLFLIAFILTIFLRYITKRFLEDYNVKLILLLEIVENKITFLKNRKLSQLDKNTKIYRLRKLY